MDTPHTASDQLKADHARRESLGSQNSQTAKEYAPNPHNCGQSHAKVKRKC